MRWSSKETCKFILDRIQAKLASWKAKHLSLISKATLYTIPIYSMQALWLLNYTCEAIDKISKSFLLDLKNNGKCIHLVNWDVITFLK